MKIDTTNIITGVFQHELENRFRCVVNINGKDEICYVASSCKLSNLIKLTGREVLLTPSIGCTALQHTLFAARLRRKTTILNLSVANTVVFEELRSKRFAFLGKRKSLQKEVLLQQYRADIFISDTNTAIEIKTVITSEKRAVFPSVKSARSVHQLERIKELLLQGYKVCYMFVALSPEVKSVVLDHTAPFYTAFLDCVDCGMSYYACSLKLHDDEITVAATLKIEL